MQILPSDAHEEAFIPLPEWPIDIIRDLAKRPIWLAGGPVRDLILGRTPHDWDFVLDGGGLQTARATANAMNGAFYPLDKSRGTGRAIVNDPHTDELMTLDFAELRAGSILEDLRLRDFTINAMALSLDGQLFDPTNGRQDLARACIRMTGPLAFQQDPARLIRAVRQAAQLHFALEPTTYQQMQRDAAAVAGVAKERVRAELVKVLRLPEAAFGLQQMDAAGILVHILPELHLTFSGNAGSSAPAHGTKPHVARSHVSQMLNVVDRWAAIAGGKLDPVPSTLLPKDIDRATPGFVKALAGSTAPLSAYLDAFVGSEVTHRDLMKWCALFLTAGTVDQNTASAFALTDARCSAFADVAEQAMGRLRFSRAAVGFVTRAVRECWRFDQLVGSVPSRRQIYTYFRDTQQTGIAVVLLSLANIAVTHSGQWHDQEWYSYLDTAQALFDAYFRLRQVVVDPRPLLTGNDLQALGLSSGPQMGALIEDLREAQAAGDVTTRSQAETWAMEKILTC